MELKPYLKTLSDDEREALAKQCSTSVGHLRNCSYGLKSIAPSLCTALEQASGKRVTRKELRDDWAAIWPELARKPRLKAPA